MAAVFTLSGKLKKDLVLAALQDTSLNLAEISRKLNVSRSSIYKYAEEAWGPDYIKNRRQQLTINDLKKNAEQSFKKANSDDQVKIISDLPRLDNPQNHLPNQNHEIEVVKPNLLNGEDENPILQDKFCKFVFNSINNKVGNKDTFICVFKLYQEISEGLRPYMTTKEIIQYLKSENKTISTNNLCAIRQLYDSGYRLNKDEKFVFTGVTQNKRTTIVIKSKFNEMQALATASSSKVSITYGGLSINWTESDPEKRIGGILKILQELNLKEKL